MLESMKLHLRKKKYEGAGLRRGKLQNYVLVYSSDDVPLALKGKILAEAF
jgi:hypothetical protein